MLTAILRQAYSSPSYDMEDSARTGTSEDVYWNIDNIIISKSPTFLISLMGAISANNN